MPSSSKPSLLPVVKQEQRKAHHPSIALLIPCSSFIAIGSWSSYISFCTPSLVALLYLPIKVNKGPSVSDGLDAPHWCQGPLWQCVRNASTTPHISFPPQLPCLAACSRHHAFYCETFQNILQVCCKLYKSSSCSAACFSSQAMRCCIVAQNGFSCNLATWRRFTKLS